MRRSGRVVTAHIVHFRIKWNPEVAFHHLDLESFLSILILYGPNLSLGRHWEGMYGPNVDWHSSRVDIVWST